MSIQNDFEYIRKRFVDDYINELEINKVEKVNSRQIRALEKTLRRFKLEDSQDPISILDQPVDYDALFKLADEENTKDYKNGDRKGIISRSANRVINLVIDFNVDQAVEKLEIKCFSENIKCQIETRQKYPINREALELYNSDVNRLCGYGPIVFGRLKKYLILKGLI